MPKFLNYLLVITILSFTFFSCSHKISRVGYTLDESQWKQCDIPIKKNIEVNNDSLKLVGKISIDDTGFSTKCNQTEAVKILKSEACALEADLIVITEEKQANFASSCYRCKASFYKGDFSADTLLANKATEFSAYDIAKEDAEAKKKNRTAFWVSFGVGFVIGYLIVSGF